MYEPLAHHPHHMTHTAAAGLASLGRGNGKMLVHMTPQEVGGLQKLAMAAGGNLSINPHTGLPEAGFLSHLLPMIAGLGLDVLSGGALTPLMSAGIVGAGDALVTGSVKNGLMAGLGAYGGASLGGGIAAQGATDVGAKLGTDYANSVASDTLAQQPAVQQALTQSGAGWGDDVASLQANNDYAARMVAQATAPSQATLDAKSALDAYNASTASPTNWANFKTGISGLTSPSSSSNVASFSGLAKAMGPAGLATASVPVLQTVQDAVQKNIPAAAASSPEYYNTTYDPRTQKYSTGNWSTQFAGQGFTGAPGKNQTATAAGPMGTYADPYQGIMALTQANPVGVARGGDVRKLAEGGQSSDPSALQQYYGNLMSGAATTSTLPKVDPSANNAYMSGIAAGTAPTSPLGSTATTPWINSGFQSEMNNLANQSSSGSTGTSNTSSGALANIACGGAAVLTYSWNPATQSYTQSGVTGGTGVGNRYSARGLGNPLDNEGTSNLLYNQGGGIAAFAHGGSPGLGGYSDGGRLLKGPGDGMSDDIPAHILGKHPQPAALADGEFVIPADVVSHLGNGSTDAGSKKLYQMMDRVRQARTGNPKQGKQIDPNKFMPV